MIFADKDSLSVGHQRCAKGGQGRGCEDYLHWSHCCSRRCFLALASRVPLWIRCRWPEAHDVNTFMMTKNTTNTQKGSPENFLRCNVNGMSFCSSAGTLDRTTPPNPAMQSTPTQRKSTVCHLTPTVSSFLPLALQTRWDITFYFTASFSLLGLTYTDWHFDNDVLLNNVVLLLVFKKSVSSYHSPALRLLPCGT